MRIHHRSPCLPVRIRFNDVVVNDHVVADHVVADHVVTDHVAP